jgi:uncharacterized membrane protein required for colicin V production
MNWLDVSMIVAGALALASGLREGLSRSGFGFLAVIAAFLSAAWLYPGKPAGFIVVFVLLVSAGILTTFLLGRWFKSAGLSWLDRVLGGALGLTNAVLLAVVGVVAVMAFAPRMPREIVAHSKFAPYAIESAHRVAEVVPEEMKSRVEESYRELSRTFPPDVRKAIPPSPWNRI